MTPCGFPRCARGVLRCVSVRPTGRSIEGPLATLTAFAAVAPGATAPLLPSLLPLLLPLLANELAKDVVRPALVALVRASLACTPLARSADKLAGTLVGVLGGVANTASTAVEPELLEEMKVRECPCAGVCRRAQQRVYGDRWGFCGGLAVALPESAPRNHTMPPPPPHTHTPPRSFFIAPPPSSPCAPVFPPRV